VDNDFHDSFSLGLDGKAARYAELLRTLPAGPTEWALHPAVGDDEARTVDQGWRVRASDYDFLTSPETRRLLAEQQIIVTDYRPVQQATRAVSQRW
jgi:chitin disaccharide deacetylase